MRRKIIMGLVLLILMPATLMVTQQSAFAARVPDTGQTKCYNNSVEIPCPSSGEAFYGQDAQYKKNPRSYAKLDAAGNALPDSATRWTMVKDNVTGLTWEGKTNDGTLHNKDLTFTWCDTNSATNGGNQGNCGTGTGDASTDTQAFINTLNSLKFGSYNDWRMPTVRELSTLVYYDNLSPAMKIDTFWFPNTSFWYYWSSTSRADESSWSWYVSFGCDIDYNAGQYQSFAVWTDKADGHRVRAVRGQQSTVRLVDNEDGTLTDTATGLMWQKVLAPGTYTWQDALSYCETLTLAGYSDWRLPDRNELQSLADYSRTTYSNGSSLLLPSTQKTQNYLWSSTTYYRDQSLAWGMYIGDSYINFLPKNGEPRYVLAVRNVNSAPVVAPAGSGVYQVNTPVVLNGQILDADGDALSYQWLEGNKVLFSGAVSSAASPYHLTSHTLDHLSLGVHTLTLLATDGKNTVSADITVEIIDTLTPVLSPAPDQTILWPPNNKMVPVTIIINASDNSGGPVSVTASVSCNEVQKAKGKSGKARAWTEPVIANGLIHLELLASRNGHGKGRVYTITIAATDLAQNTSVAAVNVLVPRHR